MESLTDGTMSLLSFFFSHAQYRDAAPGPMGHKQRSQRRE